MTSVKQYLRIGRFGSLIKHISPVNIRSDGAIMRFVDRHFSMVDGTEEYTEYTYNDKGQYLTLKQYIGGELIMDYAFSYTYDGAGNQVAKYTGTAAANKTLTISGTKNAMRKHM